MNSVKKHKLNFAKPTRSAKSRRVFVLYDGSNFYHSLRDNHIVHTSNFDYKRFASELGQSKIVNICYYIGQI